MLTLANVKNNYSEAGIKKSTMPLMKMFVLAIVAGVFISLAGVASTIGGATVENASVAKIIAACIFPAGLAMVVLNGSELFTGNNLMIISVLDKRIKIFGLLKNWIVVYIGNLVGSMFVTGLFTLGHVYTMFDNKLAVSVLNTAVAKSSISFQDAFIKGIFCNILVCVAVLMAMMADTAAGKIGALFLPILVFVLSGFEHSVANMSYITGGLFINMNYGNLGVDTSSLTWYNFFVTNLVPATLGNIVGGCLTGICAWYTSKEK